MGVVVRRFGVYLVDLDYTQGSVRGGATDSEQCALGILAHRDSSMTGVVFLL